MEPSVRTSSNVSRPITRASTAMAPTRVPSPTKFNAHDQLTSASRLSAITPTKNVETLMEIPRVVKYISKQRSQEMLDRLYIKDRVKKQAALSLLDRKYYGDSTVNATAGSTLTHEDVEACVDRMYNQARNNHKERTRVLNDKYLKPLCPVPHFSTFDQEKQAIQRLYDTTAHDNEIRKELFRKHNPIDPRLQKVIRPKDDIPKIIERLYKGERN
eukprot:PhF_6_TR1525/c0_g1_i1/m.2787